MSEQQELKDCPFCGEQINAKAIKCRHCGSMLNGGATPAPQPAPAAAPTPTPVPVSVPVAPAEKNPGCFKTTLYGIIGFICLIGGCNMLFGGGGDVMPLNTSTLEAFNDANSKAAMQLDDKRDEMSSREMASVAFRLAVKDMGYDPDKTILYWLSPEFKQEIEGADMEDGVRMAVSATIFKGLALGDGGTEKEFEQLISNWSPEVQEAAKKRRSK